MRFIRANIIRSCKPNFICPYQKSAFTSDNENPKVARGLISSSLNIANCLDFTSIEFDVWSGILKFAEIGNAVKLKRKVYIRQFNYVNKSEVFCFSNFPV